MFASIPIKTNGLVVEKVEGLQYAGFLDCSTVKDSLYKEKWPIVVHAFVQTDLALSM